MLRAYLKSGKEPVIKRVTCYGNVSFLLLCDRRHDRGGGSPNTYNVQSFKDVGQLWARRKKNKSGRVEKEAKSRRQTEATIVRARSRGLACPETLPNLMTPLWHQSSHLGCRDCSHIQMTVGYSCQSHSYSCLFLCCDVSISGILPTACKGFSSQPPPQPILLY